MNDDEKELVKVGFESAFKPFANLAERLFGGAVDQIGGGWEDRLKFRRQIRQIKLFKKLKKNIDEAGFDPRGIPDTVWIPALQQASLEDNEKLQETWANLLAFAADPSQTEVPAMYPQILKELGAREVKFLESLVASALERMSGAVHADTIDVAFSREDLRQAYADTGLIRAKVPMSSLQTDEDYWEHRADYLADANDFDMALEIVLRNRLVQEKMPTLPDPPIPTGDEKTIEAATKRYHFTYLGVAFLKACRGPDLPPIFQSKGCFGNE